MIQSTIHILSLSISGIVDFIINSKSDSSTTISYGTVGEKTIIIQSVTPNSTKTQLYTPHHDLYGKGQNYWSDCSSYDTS